MKTLYLVDGSAYIHRAFHAVRGLSNSRGLPTNAVFGFTKMMLKLIDDKKPEFAVMVFDAKGPTFRHEIYSDYKANRPPMDEALAVQIPYIKDITRAFNMPQMEMIGFEADDLIGTLARQAEKQGFMVVMVTGDKDFNQLVTGKSVVWDPMKDEIRDYDYIIENYGLKPETLIEVMALSGDTSDNIPGVVGIGPKTALLLIRQFGSVDKVYENIESITKKKQKQNLINCKEQAYMSRELVIINTKSPVFFDPEKFRLGAPDEQNLARLFTELEFTALSKAFPVKTDLSNKTYIAVTNVEDLKKLAADLKKSGLFAVDTETTSKDPMRARLVGMSFSFEPHKAFYVPCGHDYMGVSEQLSVDKALDILRDVLESPKIGKVGQNIKYDWIVLNRHGVNLGGVRFDTMVASYLLNPSLRAHSLDQIAMDRLDHRMISFAEVCGTGAKAITFDKVLIEKAVPYACEDADITFLAYNKLRPLLKENSLLELFKSMEMPLVQVLVDMELTGITVDSAHLQSLSSQFQAEMENVEQEIYRLANEEFNIASPQQLGRILFEKLGLPAQKKTKKKTGYSTDVGVLTSLAAKHELPALVLRYRSLAKLKNTYTDALTALVHPDTGRVHTSFNQNVTATGRLSSSSPNLQNIPIRTQEGRRIREAFIPRQGWEMFCADYSQIELRILAHLSQDRVLIGLFEKGEDIHARTASEVFELFLEFVTPEMRRQAKAINFGIVYGMGAFRLSKEIGVSRKTAQHYIDNYFLTYKGVKEFIDTTIEKARETGISTTLSGRIRHLPDINAKNHVLREASQRIAVNTPIQGTAADLIKIAMIQVNKALINKDMRTKMLLTVHDELVFESPPDELFQAQMLVEKIMEGVWDLQVALKVNISSGQNWAEAH